MSTMKKVAIFVLVLAMCMSMASATATWAYCSSFNGTAGALQVQTVTLNPDPPVAGTDDTVTLTGTLGETITAGSIALQITWGGIPVYSHTYNVCTDTNLACPVAPGPVSSSLVVSGSSIPVALPGSLIGQATFTDQNGVEVTCVDVTFNF